MRWLMLVTLACTVGFAQSTPLLLPLSHSGSGTSQTQTFIATSSWKFNLQSSALATVYLYDATQGQIVRTVFNGETINDTGSFFLYINAPNTTWQITVENAPASTVTTPPATTPVLPTAPTILTDPIAPTPTTPSSAEPTTPSTTPSATTTSTELSPITIEAMSRVSADSLKQWGKHFGYQIVRYNRTSSSLNEAVCSSFANVFEAQKTFMDAGGPDTDLQNLDPDGDGYACSYNPKETYTPARTCVDGKEWVNGFYKKNGSFRPSGCANKK
jgi:hypothetical protein